MFFFFFFFFFQAEDGIRDADVTGVQTCALPIYAGGRAASRSIVGYRSTAFGLARSGWAPEAYALTNGTRPASSDSAATRRHGQCVTWESRKTRRRFPRISGKSGRQKSTTTARPARKARPDRGMTAV